MSNLGNTFMSKPWNDPGDLFGQQSNSKFAKPAMPTPPNYQALIEDQAKQNRINQTTPYGSLQFSTDPKTGQVSANYSMTPQEKALYGGLQGGEKSLLGATAGGAPQFNAMGQFHPGNFSAQIGKDEQSSFNDAMALMNPQLKMQQDQLNQSMADRGLPVGSEIQGNAQNQFDQYRGGLETQAAYNALGMGQQEQAQGYNEGLNTYGANQNANLQNYGAGMEGYNANMASLGSLFNMGNNMPGLNNFYSPTGVNTLGAAGLAQNAAQQNYASQMQQYGANLGGLYGLGGAAIGAFG